jgi:hypothetical protein|tara:strand:+ start:52837 stop:53862 length:1026 start_codon:yes stop_codon:yes gene_type:complete
MKIVFSIVLALLAVLSIVNAQSISINVEMKSTFTIDEMILFNYSIISDTNQLIKFIPFVTCPDASFALLNEKSVDLQKGIPYQDSYRFIKVDESITSQTCTAYVQISSPVQLVQEKKFEIETNPSFSFELNLCKDQSCLEKSKLFIQNENIYLDFDSEITSPIITATLINPDKTTKEIILPTFIKAEQIGTYNLEVSASKEGYKTITKTTQFGVIESEADVQETSQCNANNICEPDLKENYKTCPQDCVSETKKTSFFAEVITLVILLIIIIFGYIEFRRLKDQKNLNKTHREEILLELRKYITTNLKRGYSKERIRKALIKAGWNSQEIEEAFIRLNKKY